MPAPAAPSSASSRRSWRPRLGGSLGLRREVLILVPVSMLLLVLLSLFVLTSYRSAVSVLTDEVRDRAEVAARRLAGRIDAVGRSAAAPELAAARDLGLGVQGAAVVAPDGRVLAVSGLVFTEPLSLPAEPMPFTIGPDRPSGDLVSAYAPLADGSWVRLDLAAPVLAAQRRSLGILTWVLVGIDGGLLVLVLLFIGHMLAPYERLLARARAAGAERGDGPDGPEDEVEFLLATFERALSALSALSDDAAAPDDEIGTLTRTLPSSFESGVLLVDRRGLALATNALGRELLGLGSEPTQPQPVDRLLAHQTELARLVLGAVEEGLGVQRQEVEIATGAGRSTLGLTVHPLRRESGEPRAFLVLFADLTEARERRERAQLAENLRQLGELAGGVAHELRNSLATVRGYLTLVERSGGGANAETAESLAEIRRETDHLQRVLEDFLSFARPGSVRAEELDLARLAARAAADPALEGAPVEVRHAPGGDCRMTGDPQLLERALRNLLHNAVQASRAAGAGEPVEVTCARYPEELVVTVGDRGGGVPEEIRERLFDPFVSGRADGVGLGLALARRIVLLHRGTLELAPRPGGGTVATVRFPTSTEATGTPAAD